MTKPDKIWNWKFIVFVGLQTFNFCLFYAAFPLIPKYAVSIGLDLSVAGVISGVFAFSSLIARPIAGYCIDHFHRKVIMIVALVICGLSTAAIVMTTSWGLLLILRIVYGAGFSFFSTMLVSCAADSIPDSHMAEGMSYFGLGVALAAAMAPGIALQLFDQLGARSIFILMGIMNFVCAVILFFVPIVNNDTPSGAPKKAFSFRNVLEKSVIIYAVLVIPFTFTNGFVNSFISLTAGDRNIKGISLFFTVFAVVMMVLKPLSGKIQDRHGAAAVLIPAFLFSSLAAGLISIAQSLTLMLTAAVFLAFGQGAGQPALLASSVSTPPPERRGVGISTYYIGLDFGLAIGNMIGARVASALGYTGAYLLCAGTLIAGLIILLIYECTIKRSRH